MTCRDRNLNATKALLLGLYAEGVREVLEITKPLKEKEKKDPAAIKKEIARLEREMLAAAQKLDFETAAKLRDALKLLRQEQDI